MLQVAKNKHLQPIKCENCKGMYFEVITVLVFIDSLAAGTSKDSIHPVQTFRCADCKHINENFKVKEENISASPIIVS